MSKYGLNIIWSEEDKGYVATCPEFPGLSAFGETIEEAILEAKVAQELFTETYEEEGIPLPDPQVLSGYSGQFRVRLPQTLHFQLSRMAEKEGVSLNHLIVSTLAARIGAEQVNLRLEQLVQQVIQSWVQQHTLPTYPSLNYWGPLEGCYLPIRETESNTPHRIISNIFEYSK